MKFEETTHYTEALIKEAASAYWVKTSAFNLFLSLSAAILALVLIYSFGLRTWISGTFFVISLLASGVFLSSLFIFRKRSSVVFRQMKTTTAKWIISEHQMTVEAEAGNSDIKWEMFKCIIKSKNCWLLVNKSNNYSVFPLAGVSSEALGFIEEKIQKHGG